MNFFFSSFSWNRPIILALGRLREEAHYEFKASLNYVVNSKLAWATFLSLKAEEKKDGLSFELLR